MTELHIIQTAGKIHIAVCAKLILETSTFLSVWFYLLVDFEEMSRRLLNSSVQSVLKN